MTVSNPLSFIWIRKEVLSVKARRTFLYVPSKSVWGKTRKEDENEDGSKEKGEEEKTYRDTFIQPLEVICTSDHEDSIICFQAIYFV